MWSAGSLTTALHKAGYTLTNISPDYVVLGEARTYSFSQITAPSASSKLAPA